MAEALLFFPLMLKLLALLLLPTEPLRFEGLPRCGNTAFLWLHDIRVGPVGGSHHAYKLPVDVTIRLMSLDVFVRILCRCDGEDGQEGQHGKYGVDGSKLGEELENDEDW